MEIVPASQFKSKRFLKFYVRRKFLNKAQDIDGSLISQQEVHPLEQGKQNSAISITLL